jgi:hypothetical protein
VRFATTLRKELDVKRILGVFTAWAALIGGASGQPLPANKVPANVWDAFQSKFPSVDKVEWKLKSDKNYEAESSKPRRLSAPVTNPSCLRFISRTPRRF